jgi:hypothetical protein
MSEKELEKLLKKILDKVPGGLAAFANKKYTSHNCLPDWWLSVCMAEYKAAFGEGVEYSIVDLAAVRAEMAWHGGLGWGEAEDTDEDRCRCGGRGAMTAVRRRVVVDLVRRR